MRTLVTSLSVCALYAAVGPCRGPRVVVAYMFSHTLYSTRTPSTSSQTVALSLRRDAPNSIQRYTHIYTQYRYSRSAAVVSLCLRPPQPRYN